MTFRLLLQHERGAVYVEYLTLLVLVTLVAAAALGFCGWSLLELYLGNRTMLLLPFP